MSLGDVYRQGLDVARAVYTGLGFSEKWMRWPAPTPAHLDHLPVSIRRQGEVWEVVLDYASIGLTEWRDFDVEVRGLAVAKLCAISNLKAFAREHGVQYSGLWRAKSSEGLTDRIIDLVGACPEVAVRMPAPGVVVPGAAGGSP